MRLKTFSLDSIFSSSWALWAIAILSAVIMWIYVTGLEENEYITRKFTTKLEYRGLDAQAMLRGRVSEVDIEIRGSEEAIMRLNYDFVNAYVDARNLVPGKKYTVNVNVDTPRDIIFVSCFPSQITLDLVRQVTRLMTVETILPQNIPEGQYIEGVEIIPKEAGIKGAEDDVSKVGSLRVTPTIEELQAGRELLIPVKILQSEPFEGSVTVEPAQVRFRGILARGLPRKRVPVDVRLTGKLDADYDVKSITTDPSEIQVEGKAADLSRVETVFTEVIDVSSMSENQNIVVPLKQPEIEGVSIVNASSVRVNLQLSEVRAEKMLANIPVEFRGTETPDKWLSNPSTVSVTIEGRPSLIEKFSADDIKIKAYVDMSNIFMAPVTLPVKAEIMLSADVVSPFRVVKVEPNNLTINALGDNSI
ncbi:MAG: hypothetical protein IJP69_04210 [Synergistaceae bacterium]|nr:hypothetical protein [Synergistaceae bacterium]